MSDLKHKATRASMLMAAISFGLRPISLALGVIVARLLVPEDFGLFALSMVLMTTANLFTDVGMRPALIQTKLDLKLVTYYAFVIIMITSVLFTGIVMLAAEPLAAFLGGGPELVPILRWMSLYVVIDGFWLVPEALLRRELKFKEVSLAMIPGELSSTIIAIPLAYYGFGVWSLVIGTLSGQVLRIFLLYYLQRPWIWLRPQKWDKDIVKQLLNFGMPSMGSGVLKNVQNQLDTWLVGRALGANSVGLYSRAFSLTTRMSDMLTSSIFGYVLFPSYSKMQDDKPRLARTYLKSSKMVFLMIVPISVGLAITAPLLVPVLLGDQWLPMIPVWQIFSLYGLTRPTSTNSSPVFLSVGQPRRNLSASLVAIGVMVPLLLILMGPYGITGAAVAVSLASLVAMLFNVFQVNQILPGTAWKTFTQSMPFLLAGGLMALGVIVAEPFIINLAGGENVLALILMIIVGALVYIGAVAVMQRPLLLEIYELIIKAVGFDRRWPRLLPQHARTSK